MRARLLVFPIKGRNWCFMRSIDRLVPESESANSHIPSTLRDLWKRISSNSKPLNANAEVVVDFVSNKMNRAWTGLEMAPEGTIKKRIYGLGLRLLARVKPSEIFLRSISKDISQVEITYPSSLNTRLVRRRLRHIAKRGTIIHRKYFYGSVTLLPLTSAFTVLPLPNVPFFWVLFRTYSHWRAMQGSERLLHLVSNCSEAQVSTLVNADGSETEHDYISEKNNPNFSQWVLQPSQELEKLLDGEDPNKGLSECAISKICNRFDLNMVEVLKYQDKM